MDINDHIGLTIDECLEVLQNANIHQKYNKETISFDIKPISETPKGFCGEHLILNISYKTTNDETETKRFFLKNLSGITEIITMMADSLNSYDKEEFIYHIFRKECIAMGIDYSFAPRGYYARPRMLIMEDISQIGFNTGNQLNPMNFGQCRSIFDTLAKFHMSVVIYEHEKRKIDAGYSLASERPHIVLERKDKDGKVNVMERFVLASIDGILATIDILPEDDLNEGINKEVFKQRLRTYMNEFYDDLTAKEGDLCCLLHNDLWCNNIMFQYPPTSTPDVNGSTTDAPVDCKLIDYQILSYGYPALDVMRVIYTNTMQDTRDKHKEQLLRHYYQATVECLQKFGISPASLGNWTWDIFSSTCDRVGLAMKIRCTAARTMTFLPEAVAAKYQPHTDSAGKERLIFDDRVGSMLDSFTTESGDLYRTVIGEDLRELWRMLQEREEKISRNGAV